MRTHILRYFVPTTSRYAIVKDLCPAARKLLANHGGGERDRTDDPLRARQVLSQLSYTPVKPVLRSMFKVLRFLT